MDETPLKVPNTELPSLESLDKKKNAFHLKSLRVPGRRPGWARKRDRRRAERLAGGR